MIRMSWRVGLEGVVGDSNDRTVGRTARATIAAIRIDQPYNEVDRGVMASLTTSMGRMAAHTGRLITMEEMLEHDHEFAPDLAKLDYDAPAPLQKLPNGKYPIPMPGITKKREY